MKQRFGALLAVLGLVAACSSGAAATPAAVSPSPANPAPASSPSPAAVSSMATASATVTFDGTNCKYTGPSVLPSPVAFTVNYRPASPAQEGSSVFVAAIKHETTMADVERAGAEGRGVDMGNEPEWVDPWTFHAQLGTGSATFELKVLHNPVHDDGITWPGTYDKYIVSCISAIPGLPAKDSYIIQLVE